MGVWKGQITGVFRFAWKMKGRGKVRLQEQVKQEKGKKKAAISESR